MAKFVKKEKMINAWQFTGTTVSEWMEFCDGIGLIDDGFGYESDDRVYGIIYSAEGELRCYSGDMVVKDRRGIFSTMPKHVFDNIYSEVQFEFGEKVSIDSDGEKIEGIIIGVGKFDEEFGFGKKQYLVKIEDLIQDYAEWFPINALTKVDN